MESLAGFRARHGHELIDWIADYIENIEQQRGHVDRSHPATCAPSCTEHPPATPEAFDAVMADTDRVIVPGLTHWQHPNFFAYFPANSSYPAILGDLLTAGLGVQGMSWVTSPACTEVETLMVDWMHELLGLPETFRIDERDRWRRDPRVGERGDAGVDPRGAVADHRRRRQHATATPPVSLHMQRRRPTPASRRACASPASAPIACASSPTTSTSPCDPTRSPR